MPIEESTLPGVGKKHEIDLGGGVRLVIVTHNTGKREVFKKADENTDAERLFEISDSLARTVGTILEGAYFQPIESDDRATTLGNGTLIEWFDVATGAPLEGETMADLLSDDEILVAVVAVQRGDQVIPASKPEKRLLPGDTVVAVGTKEHLEAFSSLLAGDRDGFTES